MTSAKRFLLILLGLAAGCGGDEFAPYYRAEGLRVLAIRAEPPELRPGETATIEALTTSESLRYEWSWCPVRASGSQDFRCPLSEAVEVPFDLELGDEAVASLSYPVTPELVLEYCRQLQRALADAPAGIAGAVPVVDCRRGLEVSVRLGLQGDEEAMTAGKRVNLWTGGPFERNENPRVGPLEGRMSGDDFAPLDSLSIEAGDEVELGANLDQSSIQSWTPPAPDGSSLEYLPPEDEVLEFQWFVAAGELENSRRLFAPDVGLGLDIAQTATWTTPSDPGTYRVWVVVRDGRLGAAWSHADVVVR